MACVTLTIRCQGPAGRILRSLCLVSSRSFSKGKTASAAQNFTDYNSICEQYKPEVPEYFNFAKDVVDNWAQSEKVSFLPPPSFAPVITFKGSPVGGIQVVLDLTIVMKLSLTFLWLSESHPFLLQLLSESLQLVVQKSTLSLPKGHVHCPRCCT